MSSLGDVGAHRHVLVSQRLRDRRRSLGLTQKQVVSRLGRLGVLTTNKALSSLEHGAGLDVAKLPELAQALDCSITYLLGLTDDPKAWEPDSRDHDHGSQADRGHHHGPGRGRPGEARPTPAVARTAVAQPDPPGGPRPGHRPWILGPLGGED